MKTRPRGERVSASEIATRLGIDHKTALRWLREKGAPSADDKGRFAFTAAAAWIGKHAPRAMTTPGMLSLRERLLALRVAGAEREERVASGEYVPKSSIKPAVVAFMGELTANLRSKFELSLPKQYEGRTLIERQQMNCDAIDWVLERLKSGAKPITEENKAPIEVDTGGKDE